MNYILNDDHTFMKKKDKIEKGDLKHMKYALINISTDRKGPLFTVVRDINFGFQGDLIHVSMDISYDPFDCPSDGTIQIPSSFSVNTMEKMYNVYPLVQQMLGFNDYRNNLECNDSVVFIENIEIYYNQKRILINERDDSDAIRKTFKRLGMATCTNEFFKSGKKALFLCGTEWSLDTISYDEDMVLWRVYDFDKIGFYLPQTESFYLMNKKDFLLFMGIDALEVSILYNSNIDYVEDFEEYDPRDDMINIAYASTFLDIMMTCLFAPQMILLEKAIYDDRLSIYVMIDTPQKYLNLLITDSDLEKPRNLCLYQIIKKLLKMQPLNNLKRR